ncbi:MAG: alpha/beta hydrolase [Chloroflexota bacterium]|nr:alpha/beta hydrolase [Chloroflexota bacterium]
MPTLILAGAYDQQTPASWNKLAFVSLPNAYFVEFPMSGHGVIGFSPCAAEVVSDFVEQPSTEPDTARVADLKPVWVLPGNAIPAATPVAEPQS